MRHYNWFNKEVDTMVLLHFERLRIVCLLTTMMILSAGALAQMSGDEYQTTTGKLIIHPVLHGTLVIEWQGKIIYVDPYGGAAAFKDIPAPDLILITDIHGDHLHEETLRAVVTRQTALLAPQAVVDKLPKDLPLSLKTIGNGESTLIEGVNVAALAMYNLPQTAESRHPKGRGNGYILSLGGKRVYISGDTHGIPEMRALKNIDIAFVCMNPPNTMSVEEAADAVLAFKPAVVYPFHYRSREGFSDVEAFRQLVMKASSIDVRLGDWYPVKE